MNRVRSFLNMRCMLPGYSLEPKPNMPQISRPSYFFMPAGSIIAIGFVTKRTLALEKPVWREKTRLTSPEVRDAAASKSWRYFGQSLLFSSSVKKKTKGGSARRVGKVRGLVSQWIYLHVWKRGEDHGKVLLIRGKCRKYANEYGGIWNSINVCWKQMRMLRTMFFGW